MCKNEVASKQNWIWKVIVILTGLGLLWIAFAGTDITEVWRKAEAIGWGIVGVLVIYLLTFLIDSISWQLALVCVPTNLQWMWRTFAVRMVGETYNNIIPAASMGGEPIKALLLKRHYTVPFLDSTASLILAKTINMVGLCLFLIVGFFLMFETEKLSAVYRHTAGVGLIGMLIATGVFFFIQRLSITSTAGNWLSEWSLLKKTHWLVAQVRRMDKTLVNFYTTHRFRFCAALTLAFANWFLGAVEIYFVLWLLNFPITWSEAWIIEAAVQMVRSGTFFIPLSIGAQEGVFLIVAGAITGDPALGLTTGLVRRYRELLWIALGYIIGVCYTARFSRLNPASNHD